MIKQSFFALSLALTLMLTIILTLMLIGFPVQKAKADGCYICTRGSICGQYCRYSGKDTQANRKKCRKAGCKIGGTASCRSSANLKICTGSLPQPSFRYAGRLDLKGLLTSIK